MALTYYRYDDASAPTLTGQAGSLVALLDAVLVTGYGAKAAAGWTKPYTGTNKAAFRMATGAGKNGHYLRVLDDGSLADGGARNTALIGYTSMTTVDAGTDDFPVVTQRSNAAGLTLVKSNTLDAVARPWLIAADDTFFFFYSQHSTTSFVNNPSGRQTQAMFGQIESFVPGDSNHTLISSKNNGAYSDTSGLTEGLRAVVTSFSTITRNFLAKDSLGLRSAESQLATPAFPASATAVPGTNTGPINQMDGSITYTSTVAMEKDLGSALSIARGTVPYIYQFDAQTGSTLFQSTIEFFTVLTGEGVDAGKTFLVIPTYYSSSAYSTLLQISGSR